MVRKGRGCPLPIFEEAFGLPSMTAIPIVAGVSQERHRQLLILLDLSASQTSSQQCLAMTFPMHSYIHYSMEGTGNKKDALMSSGIMITAAPLTGGDFWTSFLKSYHNNHITVLSNGHEGGIWWKVSISGIDNAAFYPDRPLRRGEKYHRYCAQAGDLPAIPCKRQIGEQYREGHHIMVEKNALWQGTTQTFSVLWDWPENARAGNAAAKGSSAK